MYVYIKKTTSPALLESFFEKLFISGKNNFFLQTKKLVFLHKYQDF